MKITVCKDAERVAYIHEQLKITKGYCPCSLIQTEDTKCICKEFREQEEGECHCGLYMKVKDD